MALPLIGALVLTVLVGDVPAWTLAIVLAASVILVAAISIEHRRELGRVEGALAVERDRREKSDHEVARFRETTSITEPETGGLQKGLLFRIQSLRGGLEARAQNTYETTTSQNQALARLASDIRDYLGASTTLDDIAKEWKAPGFDVGVEDAITALGQLEGMVISGRPADSRP